MTALVALLLVAAPVGSLAPTGPPQLSRFAVTGDFTSLLLINSAGVSLTARLSKGFAVSLGGGGGFALRLGPPVLFGGGQLLAHGLLGGERHFFELAAGVSVVFSEEYAAFMRPFVVAAPLALMPAGFIGYRFQRSEGGPLVRAGIALSYGFNPGFALSIGHAF